MKQRQSTVVHLDVGIHPKRKAACGSQTGRLSDLRTDTRCVACLKASPHPDGTMTTWEREHVA